MNRAYDVDLLVAGQGFAGSALAHAARAAGLSVLVADPDPAPGSSASRVAAGLITPLTGKKINPGWRLDELLPLAREFYARAGTVLGRNFFHDGAVHRWFADAGEDEAFRARLDDPRISRWCDGLLPPDPRVKAPWGGFAMRGGGWLDPVGWLDATRSWLVGQGAFVAETLAGEDIDADGDGVVWRGRRARHLVFCNGLAAAGCRFFPGLPFRPASGEVLEITLEGGPPPVIWNTGGKWLAPRAGGTCLCGATYGFGEWIPRLRPEGVAELRAHLEALLRVPWSITGHRIGVRPILHQSRPVVGFHPAHPRVGLLNGLGSKGVLTAPWAAGQLVAAMVHGTALDPELDLAGFHGWPGSRTPKC